MPWIKTVDQKFQNAFNALNKHTNRIIETQNNLAMTPPSQTKKQGRHLEKKFAKLIKKLMDDMKKMKKHQAGSAALDPEDLTQLIEKLKTVKISENGQFRNMSQGAGKDYNEDSVSSVGQSFWSAIQQLDKLVQSLQTDMIKNSMLFNMAEHEESIMIETTRDTARTSAQAYEITEPQATRILTDTSGYAHLPAGLKKAPTLYDQLPSGRNETDTYDHIGKGNGSQSTAATYDHLDPSKSHTYEEVDFSTAAPREMKRNPLYVSGDTTAQPRTLTHTTMKIPSVLEEVGNKLGALVLGLNEKNDRMIKAELKMLFTLLAKIGADNHKALEKIPAQDVAAFLKKHWNDFDKIILADSAGKFENTGATTKIINQFTKAASKHTTSVAAPTSKIATVFAASQATSSTMEGQKPAAPLMRIRTNADGKTVTVTQKGVEYRIPRENSTGGLTAG